MWFIEGENTDLIRQHLVEFMNSPIDGLIIYGKNSAELIGWVNRFVDRQIPVVTINRFTGK